MVKAKEATIEELQNRIYELEKQYNTYDQVFNTFVDGFVIEQTNNVKTIKIETLQTWFSNPDEHMDEISNLLTYYYITDGDIFQLYDLIFSLPRLDYKITAFDGMTKSYQKDVVKIRQVLERKLNYKRLTRDLLIQMAHDGTVIGTWLGNSTNPYFYIFSDLEHVFPLGTYRGNMRAVFDLSLLDRLQVKEINALYDNLKPLITEAKYNKWKNATGDKKEEYQYILLPEDKSLVARMHTLYNNQRLGIPYGVQTLLDINHKQKMKELERSIADKVIKAIAVLKFKGKDDNDNKVSDTAKTKVFKAVKKALEKGNNSKNGTISVVAIPDFADFKPTEFRGIDEALKPEKYESVNRDMSVSTGVNDVLVGGNSGNYASAKLNLDIMYQKIAVMLEEIEVVFNQLINIVLGEKKGMNYKFEFIKGTPLSTKEKVDNLMKLQANGYSMMTVLQEMGINAEQYIAQSMYEIDVLKLREKIVPPLSTYTATGSDVGGAPKKEDTTNDNTIDSQEISGTDTPRAKV